jgi:hypothetical protein
MTAVEIGDMIERVALKAMVAMDCLLKKVVRLVLMKVI